MKSDFVRRMLLMFCAIVAVGMGFRELTSGRQSQEVAAGVIAVHRDAMRARAVAMHREGASNGAVSASRAASAANAASSANAKAAKAARHGPTPREKLTALRAPLSLVSANDPFTASSWMPPPPPPVVAPPAPPEPVAPPTAPAVPFVYLGELDAKTARPQVFLSSGDRLLIVSPGEVVDGQYRVESISEDGVVLTYLPLGQKQVLSTQAKDNK